MMIDKLKNKFFPLPLESARILKGGIQDHFLFPDKQIEGIKKANIKDTDIYLKYLAGRGIFKCSFIISLSVCLLVYIHSFYGFLPQLDVVYRDGIVGNINPISIFPSVMRYAGYLLLLCLIYYFLYFSSHISFREYNPLRNGTGYDPMSYTLHEWMILTLTTFIIWFAFYSVPLCLTIFLDLSGNAIGIYNCIPWLFFAGFIGACAYALTVNAIYLFTISWAYIIYIRVRG